MGLDGYEYEWVRILLGRGRPAVFLVTLRMIMKLWLVPKASVALLAAICVPHLVPEYS